MLKAHGIDDVHCEIRETLVKTAASSVPALAHSDIALGGSYFTDFTRTIGQSIALETEPTREATLTCYVALPEKQTHEPQRYALISRHLAFSEGDGRDNISYNYAKSGPKHYIIMPGDRTLEKTYETVENDLKSWRDQILTVDPDSPMFQVAKEQLRMTEAFKKHLRSLENPRSRRIGYVVYSPARLPETQTNDFGGTENLKKVNWLPDYAIVHLDTGRLESRHVALNNLMYLKDQGVVPKELNDGLGAATRYQFPVNSEVLRMRGVIPSKELYRPTLRYGRMHYTTGDIVLRIGKRGRTTGLTWGQGNQITSVTRENFNGQHINSLHWPVQSISRSAFSARGDSGAVLFTADGHLAAMIDGGSGEGRLKQFDVTYATPLEWIRDHIKRNAFPSVFFL